MFYQKKQSPGLLISGSIIAKENIARAKIAFSPGSKKKHYGFIIIGLIALLLLAAYYLRPFPSTYLSYPLTISPELAASFGEVRKDHFHMGLDLRTKGRENLPVLAIADGFISRVQVSENGFGKAVYVTHPNGMTSVYAHLSRFSEAVEKCVHRQQYQQEQWEQDLRFPKDSFPVRKGEVIARSGNTGTSEGPHLHMELRNTATGNSLNPQREGLTVSDNMHPVIKNIYWYNKRGSIYETNAIRLPLTAGTQQVVEVSSPRIILGVETFDKNAATRFLLGIYKATLYMDDQLKHHFSMDEIPQNDTRYVNGSIDYNEFVAGRKTIQLLATLPGNRLALFSKAPESGVLDLSDQKVHRIKIAVQDAAGNNTEMAFAIRFNGVKQLPLSRSKNVVWGVPGKDVVLQHGQTIVRVGKNVLFDSVPVAIAATNTLYANAVSQRIDISPSGVPLYDSLEITMPCTLAKEDVLRQRVVMLVQTAMGRAVIKGVWNNYKMTSKLPGFGVVQLVTDTIPPSISLVNAMDTYLPAEERTVRVVCKDNLGVAAFRATIDGHWVVFERKGNVFTYLPDEYCEPGTHNLVITVSDIAGNSATQTFSIVR